MYLQVYEIMIKPARRGWRRGWKYLTFIEPQVPEISHILISFQSHSTLTHLTDEEEVSYLVITGRVSIKTQICLPPEILLTT